MKRPLLARFFGVARASAFLAFAFGVVGVVALGRVRADVGEAGLLVGRDLSRLGELVARTHRVRLNGEPVYVASATVPAKPTEVLDRVERLCADATGGLADDLADPDKLAKALPAGTELRGLALGILRTDGAKDGVAACLARPGKEGFAGLAERLSDFARTGDLGRLGDLRYAYARPTADGGSHVVTVWTEGSVRLDRLFPRGGDAPGDDPPDMPRPPGLARLLSAKVDDAPYGAFVFEGPGTVDGVLAFYDDALPKAGWVEARTVRGEDPTARAYSRGGLDVLVVTRDEGGGRVAASLAVMEAKAP